MIDLTLGILRELVAYLDNEGFALRSDIRGFLDATEDLAPECMVQIGPHSIALGPSALCREPS